MTSLYRRIGVITGATSGIGKAIALGLAQEGVNLCLIGRRADALADVLEDVRARAAQARAYKVDLADDEAVEGLTRDLQRDCEGVDILVHSAGVISLGPFETSPVANLDSQYRTNLRAPFVLTQMLLPMVRKRKGQIVFINSSAGVATRPGLSQYSATKHALKAVADCLRVEVNADEVRVLSVYPGRTATPQQAAVHEHEGKPYLPQRLLQPEDVASVVIQALKAEATAEVTDINVRSFRKP